jgi:cyclophilin family peptidyl-prolyl cis-trans isomerase
MKSFCKIALIGFLTSFALGQDPAQKTIEKKKPGKSAPAKEATVIMSTSLGEIHIELDPKSAPLTVENFLKYVDSKHYDGTIFHRIIGNFMVQGGGFKETDGSFKKQPTNPPIKNESEKTPSNKRGTIAMARTSEPNSATAQFFINVVDNPFLDYPNNGGGYATFGKVVKGIEVVEKMRAVKTSSKNGMADVPTQTITINSIKRAK